MDGLWGQRNGYCMLLKNRKNTDDDDYALTLVYASPIDVIGLFQLPTPSPYP